MHGATDKCCETSFRDFNPATESIKVMTFRVSKGLEFPVGATRATQRLIIGAGGAGRFGQRLGA